MKVQQKFSNQPAFAMNATLDTRTANHGGKKMISAAEELAFKEWTKLQGAASDTFNAKISPIWINRVNDESGAVSVTDFRQTYSIRGRIVINGEEKKVNLYPTWLKSTKSSREDNAISSDFDPITIIKNYIEKAYKNVPKSNVAKN